MFELTDRVALMTGSSRGMGAAMAEGLAEQGANVVISSRKIEACETTAQAINEKVGRDAAVPIACHAGRKEQLQDLVDQTHSKLGKIDILVGNAGVNPFYGTMEDIPDEAYEKTMKANVQSNLWLCRMVKPDMEEKKRGSILITASVGAFAPSTTLGTYGMSKMAVISLVRNLAAEWGPLGIRVNALCPALVKTDFAKALWSNPEAAQRVIDQTPLRRLGEAEDFKGIAAFIGSDEASWITGQALTICGGTHMFK
ncbi:MAG: short-chain dehydrogenase [Opitutaceae bacterium]|nr:short-chain dehydrogenase [Opitutaceae bacterium]|tara:strand:- start:9192 stop:9956 length:765 start_codon:yes stop_codon:yes gene_type:complete